MAVRLADLLIGLSNMADLGFGLPMGSAVRSCVLATRIAEGLSLPAEDVHAAYYTALLHHVGCVGYAHETARLLGDELTANRAAARTDAASPRDTFTTFLPALVRDRPPLERARLAYTALTRGGRWGDQFTATACELGRDSARRIGLPAAAQTSLLHVYDMWRRRPGSHGPHGEDIPIAARVARLSGIAVLFESIGGRELAVAEVRRRGAGMLDPTLVSRFIDAATELLPDASDGDPNDVALNLEPRPHITGADVRVVAEVFGDLADLKSPYFLGHSRAVASLAAGAALSLRLPERTQSDLTVAGLLHDVGRVAVSSAVWEKRGRLSSDEWEQVRLHPYRSERILGGSKELGPLAGLVGRHHERLDGSGYHRGCLQEDLSLPSRILAAADAYRTQLEHRPHRTASEPGRARERLLDAASRSKLDHDAVQAVLGAAGYEMAAPAGSTPMGLSEREVQVLLLVAKGCSNAEIASRLVISRRTAEHHVQHIYTKIGVSSRAAATLFAVRHRLLDRNG